MIFKVFKALQIDNFWLLWFGFRPQKTSKFVFDSRGNWFKFGWWHFSDLKREHTLSLELYHGGTENNQYWRVPFSQWYHYISQQEKLSSIKYFQKKIQSKKSSNNYTLWISNINERGQLSQLSKVYKEAGRSKKNIIFLVNLWRRKVGKSWEKDLWENGSIPKFLLIKEIWMKV